MDTVRPGHGRFFEELTDEDAQGYLDAFLKAGRARVGEDWWSRLQANGVSAVLPYFAAESELVGVARVPPPDDTPTFIVEAMERDHGGFVDFADDEGRGRVLGAAFFLGSAFIHSFRSLSWSIGQPDRAEAGQPVVTGFRTGADLPVLAVAGNLLLQFDPHATSTAVATWRNVV
jgi:hypothetical protein